MLIFLTADVTLHYELTSRKFDFNPVDVRLVDNLRSVDSPFIWRSELYRFMTKLSTGLFVMMLKQSFDYVYQQFRLL